nr:DUF6482 family protein [Pseudomonas plecoglossicida]
MTDATRTTSITLQQLRSLADADSVDELELLSLEGGIYLLRVRTTTGLQTLAGEGGRPMHLRSSTHLRSLLAGFPAMRCLLVQHVVHDEMCGQREGQIEPLRLPLSLEQTW